MSKWSTRQIATAAIIAALYTAVSYTHLDVYKRQVLKTRPVLFSGTPCQVYGLYRFLGCRPENLTTCDLVCHGVPSPGVWAVSYTHLTPPSAIRT